VKSIIAARGRNGGFSSIYDFIEGVDQRLVNRKVLESLIQAGAFDSIESNRARLFAAIDSIIAYGNAVGEERERGQFSIFNGGETAKTVFPQPDLPQVEEWNRFDKLSREKELLGYYISGHPLEKYRSEVESFSHPQIEGLEDLPDGASVKLCGIITSVRKQLTKKGDMMAIVKLEDFTGSVEILFFQKSLDKFGPLLAPDSMVSVSGRVSTKEEEAVKIIGEDALPLEQARAAFTRSLQITLDTSELDAKKLSRLEKVLKAHPGETTVNFLVFSGGETIKLKSAKYKILVEDQLLQDLNDLLGAKNVKLGA
jgi:DNA polymerase-3 subunit alpha